MSQERACPKNFMYVELKSGCSSLARHHKAGHRICYKRNHVVPMELGSDIRFFLLVLSACAVHYQFLTIGSR